MTPDTVFTDGATDYVIEQVHLDGAGGITTTVVPLGPTRADA